MTKNKAEQNRTSISRYKNICGKIFVTDISQYKFLEINKNDHLTEKL